MTAIGSRDDRPAPEDPARLRHEIEQIRADLGNTVEALATKADLKARAHEAVDDAKLRVRQSLRQGVHRVRVNAARTGRELRAHPGDQARHALVRVGRSVREHPAPWTVGVGLLLLAALISPRRWRR